MAVDLVVVVLLQFCWLALEALKPSPLLADGFWYGSCLLCGIGGTAASYVHWGRVSKQSSTSTFLIVVDVGTLMSLISVVWPFAVVVVVVAVAVEQLKCLVGFPLFNNKTAFLIYLHFISILRPHTKTLGRGKLQFLKGAYQATLNKMSLRIIKHTTPKNILSVLCRFFSGVSYCCRALQFFLNNSFLPF